MNKGPTWHAKVMKIWLSPFTESVGVAHKYFDNGAQHQVYDHFLNNCQDFAKRLAFSLDRQAGIKLSSTMSTEPFIIIGLLASAPTPLGLPLRLLILGHDLYCGVDVVLEDRHTRKSGAKGTKPQVKASS